jgi:membrane fusion protein (multidrug efflux system)
MTKQTKKWVSLAAILVAALAGGLWSYGRWRHNQVFVATDDAYVRGPVVAVASRVPGTLLTVRVAENQEVKAGSVLATLDPRDFDAAEAKAQAALAEATASMALNRAQIAQAQAQVRAMDSQRALATLEEGRLKALVERDSIPRQKYDQAATGLQVATAQAEAARKQVAALQGALGVSSGKAAQSQASLNQSRLQRSYCAIPAPCDGFVTRKLGEPGMVVAAGQPLLAVVPLGQEELWIEANFKETQLKNVRVGQRVSLRTDLAEDQELQGTVESIAAGTGSVFSLLPPENATGNWVKVVQRVPVRIRLTPGTAARHKLRLGFSVAAVIDTRS